MNNKLLQRLFTKAFLFKGYNDLKSMQSNSRNARKINDNLLLKIVKSNKNTEYGRKYNFSNVKSIEDYRKLVPLSTYKDYEPYINDMIYKYKENLITSYKIIGYAKSSGTVANPKYLPLTQNQINIYTKYTFTRMMALADKHYYRAHDKHQKINRGICTFPSFDYYLPNGMLGSNVADVAAKQLSFFHQFILDIPFKKQVNSAEFDFRYINGRFGLEDKECSYVFGVFFKNITDLIMYLQDNWKMLVDDIENGTINESVRGNENIKSKLRSIIKPNPERAKELREEFEKGFDDTILERIWPNMIVMSGVGTSTFEAYVKKARQYSKHIPFDYSIYGASEGLYAACDQLNSIKQLLLVDSCYFEFIPVDDETKIYSLNELKVNEEYEIVITNYSGLYRYRCGDIIKVLDYMNECPYIVFSRRKGQLLNVIGEKTTEQHMEATIEKLSDKANVEITDWCVHICTDTYPNYYELLLENKDNIDLTKYSDDAQEILKVVNERYKDLCRTEIGHLRILNLKYGTQAEWTDLRIKSGASISQIKPIRILDNEMKEKFFMERVI